jgi:hypothetical protein
MAYHFCFHFKCFIQQIELIVVYFSSSDCILACINKYIFEKNSINPNL